MNKLKDAYERYLHCDALYNTRYESYFPPEIIKWGMEEIERLQHEDIAILEKEFKETIEGAEEQINRFWKALEKIYHMRNIDVKIHNIAARALWYEEKTK